MNNTQEILDRLKAEGLTVAIAGGRLAVSGQTSRLNASFRELISENRDSLIEALNVVQIDEPTDHPFEHLTERLDELSRFGVRLRADGSRLLVCRGTAPVELLKWIDSNRIDLLNLAAECFPIGDTLAEWLLESEQERAAIFEHDAGMRQAEAEQKAFQWLECRFCCDWCNLEHCDSFDRQRTCRICGTCFVS